MEGNGDAPRTRIAVLIVAEVRLYRDGLAELLERDGRMAVVGMAGSVQEGIRRICESRPDVVLLDLAVPEGAGAIRGLAGAARDLKVVALTVPEAESVVIGCAEAGVSGYVTRDATVADVVATVESAVRGETLCTPRIARMLVQRVTAVARDEAAQQSQGTLTRRETQVVALIGDGLSNKEIARRLFIEVATVKNHVHNSLEKLGVSRREEAVARLSTAADGHVALPAGPHLGRLGACPSNGDFGSPHGTRPHQTQPSPVLIRLLSHSTLESHRSTCSLSHRAITDPRS